MKKTLKRIGAMCLVFAASMSMQAQTVTATWDFANNCAGLGAKGQDGSTMTATTIASDVDGIAITVEYNGGSIKNNDNSYQVSNGVVFKIPVISARDEITVEGYNGYSHYVFGDGEEMTNTNTHKVTVAEAAQGYVALKSVNNNNYYNKITVVQKGAIMEQRLYSTDFTNWKALSASTSETTVSVKTKYTAETLDFKLFDTEVKPDGTNAKFEGQGWLMAAKSDDPYIITSALKHISKVHYVHAATGGSRGWKLECKGDGDADWVVLSSSFCEQAGSPVDVTVNRTNCQLRWTNLNGSQNAYMLELAIYGNVDMSKEPMLGSFVANGTTYQAVEIFDMDENGDYVADIEVSKKATMISASNPLTEVTAENGTLGTISYEAQSDNSCIATIP
ncbi:MAG: pectin esterase, partial [Prevotella sp.]|nr:pectin esterase [Prevotella sp.]